MVINLFDPAVNDHIDSIPDYKVPPDMFKESAYNYLITAFLGYDNMEEKPIYK